MNARREFVDRLRAKRIRLGITQKAIASRLGVCNRTVNRWELHLRAPRAQMAGAWAAALGVRVVGGSIEELFRPDVPPCGTDLGYHRHQRRGQRCQPCWAAHAAYIGELARAKRGVCSD